MNPSSVRQRDCDFNDHDAADDQDTWQPLGAVLQREAHRLDLCRERAVMTTSNGVPGGEAILAKFTSLEPWA